MKFSGSELIERINKIIESKGLKRDPDLYKIVPSGTLSAWKNKGQIPRVNTICNIANFLGVSIEYLLTGNEGNSFTQEEQELITKYKTLSRENKRNVRALVDSMLISGTREKDLKS